MKTTFALSDLRGLMSRDIWALTMLAEHQALTTDQFTALDYDSTSAGAVRQLRILARHGWLVRVGSAWRLGPIFDPQRPYDEAIADGAYSYVRP